VTTLLLHGFTGSSQAWGEGLVDALTSAVGPPVLIDLPGHGRHAGETDPARFTLEGAFRIIEDASAGEPMDLVGYSMGGRVALAFAATHPERVRRLVEDERFQRWHGRSDAAEKRWMCSTGAQGGQ